MKKVKFLIVFLLSMIVKETYSQIKPKSPVEYINSLNFTFGAGTSTYYGDLCDRMECMVFRPTTGAGILYRNSSRLLLRSEFYYVRLYGTDEGGDNFMRNLHFRSNNFEFSATAIYDFIDYERKFKYRSRYTPYGFLGVGVTSFSPQAKLDGKWYKLRPLQTEGVRYSSFTPSIPYGLGVRIKVARGIDISLEGGYRWTFTDYLDDVSSTYVDNSSFDNDIARRLADRTDEQAKTPKNRNYDYGTQTWNAGHIRGNPKRNDGYFIFAAKLEYRLKYTVQSGGILRRSKF